MSVTLTFMFIFVILRLYTHLTVTHSFGIDNGEPLLAYFVFLVDVVTCQLLVLCVTSTV